MGCNTCGCVRFGDATYNEYGHRHPALACERCGTLEIDETLGATEKERVAIRWTVLARVSAGRLLTPS